MSSVHISLNVSNLDTSVDFYRRFLGEPAKLKADYAKFVTSDPGIHLAMQPTLSSRPPVGALSHLGIRVETDAEVRRWRDHVQERGLSFEDEINTTCCYARQDKFWVTDPDGNRWEVYNVLEDVDALPLVDGKSACCLPAGATSDGVAR
ncbi:MAG: ArsI/CadI family heavy metal resistance metalloenzyme [Thermoanaerobaculia bacterium]